MKKLLDNIFTQSAVNLITENSFVWLEEKENLEISPVFFRATNFEEDSMFPYMWTWWYSFSNGEKVRICDYNVTWRLWKIFPRQSERAEALWEEAS